MKRLSSLVVILALLFTGAAWSAETVQEVYARGVRAYSSGDLDAAKALFAQVLEADPKNVGATAFLRRINLANAAGVSLDKQLAKVIVPKIDFRDTSVSSVLEYLPKLAAEQKVALNIVQMFPADYGREKTISLQLTNVPLASILNYVAQLAGLKLEYQAHAVVMKLPGAEGGTEPSAAPQ